MSPLKRQKNVSFSDLVTGVLSLGLVSPFTAKYKSPPAMPWQKMIDSVTGGMMMAYAQGVYSALIDIPEAVVGTFSDEVVKGRHKRVIGCWLALPY